MALVDHGTLTPVTRWLFLGSILLTSESLDHATGAALMAAVARISRAVSAAFPIKGLSLWHSVGEAALQEVPHLHIHLHPRLLNDNLLKVYPSAPALPDKTTRDAYAATLRSYLDKSC